MKGPWRTISIISALYTVPVFRIRHKTETFSPSPSVTGLFYTLSFFESQKKKKKKKIVTYVFVHFSLSLKKKFLFFFFFFLRNQKFYGFLCVLDSYYEKSSGVQHPADKTLTKKNFNFKQFLNYLTDPLYIWYDGKTTWLTFNYVFFDDLDSRSKVKIQGQTENWVNLCSYLKTHLTHRLHTWYKDTTQ